MLFEELHDERGIVAMPDEPFVELEIAALEVEFNSVVLVE